MEIWDNIDISEPIFGTDGTIYHHVDGMEVVPQDFESADWRFTPSGCVIYKGYIYGLSIANQVELIIICEQFASLLYRFYGLSRLSRQFFTPPVDNIDSIDPVLLDRRKTINLKIRRP
jgi:hypothetical protein